MARALLFDIDQTLLYTGGAGSKAMTLAFQDLFGIADGLAGLEFSGRTDVAIFRDALRRHEVDGQFPVLLERFKAAYVRHLESTLPETKGSLLPGIDELLKALGQRDDVLLGLATGNFRRSADLKLRHYRIQSRFLGGGFADDAEDRAGIVRTAARRVLGEEPRDGQVVVIGDTPYDVAAAKANRAVAVGVATGLYSLDDLTRAGADMVLPDFSRWEEAIPSLLGWGR